MENHNLPNKLMEKLSALNKERSRHIFSLTHGKPMIHGLLSAVFRRCGKPACKCNHGEKHGPYLAMSVNKDGKQRTVMVKKKDSPEVRKKSERYRHFQQTLAKIRRINKEVDAILDQIKAESIEPYT